MGSTPIRRIYLFFPKKASMVELVDTEDSKSFAFWYAGSIPARSTYFNNGKNFISIYF